MPYEFQTKKKRIARKDDKRVKLSEEQREEIRINSDGLSQRKLAAMYGVSRRLIQFIMDPAKHAANLAAREARGGTAQYYQKEKHAEYTRKHRRRKQELNKKGKLI